MTTPTTTIDDIDTFKYMDISNWPEKISFFSTPTEQMTLPEKAMCRSVQTFLIMNKKKIIYEERANAEFMSPTSKCALITLKINDSRSDGRIHELVGFRTVPILPSFRRSIFANHSDLVYFGQLFLQSILLTHTFDQSLSNLFLRSIHLIYFFLIKY